MKHCSKCKKQKKYSQFYKNKRVKSGYGSWCKSCTSAVRKKYRGSRKTYRESNKMLLADYKLRMKYGITFEDKQRMIELQEDKCLGCKELFTDSKSTHVDHDHKTNKIRGILCRSCNTILGYAKDNPEILQSLVDYLMIANIEERRARKSVQSESDSHNLFKSSKTTPKPEMEWAS